MQEEETRAKVAESANAQAIVDEANRARVAESCNVCNIAKNTADINAILDRLEEAGIGNNPISEPGVASGKFASGFIGDNFVIQWESVLNAQYQIQSSTNLTDWVDEGGILTGTGASMSWANPITESQQEFYRVIGK
jgi:hypothetical protein